MIVSALPNNIAMMQGQRGAAAAEAPPPSHPEQQLQHHSSNAAVAVAAESGMTEGVVVVDAPANTTTTNNNAVDVDNEDGGALLGPSSAATTAASSTASSTELQQDTTSTGTAAVATNGNNKTAPPPPHPPVELYNAMPQQQQEFLYNAQQPPHQPNQNNHIPLPYEIGNPPQLDEGLYHQQQQHQPADTTTSEQQQQQHTNDAAAELGEEEPLKLFVGQVPKQMNEEDIFPTFDTFGPLKDVAIIRDKHTGLHRGCAFVTFWAASDALRAQEALHDVFTFPGAKRAAQVKPAEPTRKLPENKLFIGMLSRTAGEEDVQELFAPFGEIREIHMIRSSDGTSRCAAFLRFTKRESAVQAIEHLNNNNIVMEGASRPLIVKFADNKHQRQQRYMRNMRKQEMIMGGGGPPGMNHHPHHHHNAGGGRGGPPYGGGGGGGYQNHHHPHHPGHHGGHHPQGMHPGAGAAATGYSPMAPPPQFAAHPYYGAPPGAPLPPPSLHHPYMYAPHQQPPFPPAASAPTNLYGSAPDQQQRQQPPPAPQQQQPNPQQGGGGGGGGSPSSSAEQQQQQPHDGTAGPNPPRPREGPAGANLFVYHLPHDLTDADLATAFNSFGNVISAKVYVDKYTGESKGFGTCRESLWRGAERVCTQSSRCSLFVLDS